MPESYPFASENHKTPYELREMHVGLSGKTTHRVLFRIQSDTIEVLCRDGLHSAALAADHFVDFQGFA